MIHSMTGFGRWRETSDGWDITVEIKTVNNRFLDCNAKISRPFSYLEERVKPYLQAHGITRGKVDVSVSVDAPAAKQTSLSLNSGYVAGYLEVLCDLRDRFGLSDDISVMTVARNPDVFQSEKPEEDAEGDWNRIRIVLDKAVSILLAARVREGEALGNDLREKIAFIRDCTDRIKALSAADVTTYRERLTQRIRESLADNGIVPDEIRLLTECAIHADRIAVDEELVRLGTHLDSFLSILSSDEPVGRKLDFLLQEMNREINTTGSKCANADISRIVVDVKCELEKIREQIQNLE